MGDPRICGNGMTSAVAAPCAKMQYGYLAILIGDEAPTGTMV